MNRRELLQISALATTASPALAQMAQWTPKLFDAHQNETVVVLTELIIPTTDTPGAKAANVNRYMDLMLNDGPAPERERFLEGLSFLDGYALRKHQMPFIKLSAAQQTAILEAFDGGAEGETAPGHAFFRMAKQLTSRIYYSTEIGYRELNKGGRVPATVACKS
jgi:hypothetical protein